MLQETCENTKATAKSDFLILLLLVAGIVLARVLANLVAAIPYFGGIMQLVILAAMIVAVYMLYKKRLCSYRYTVVYEAPPAEDLDPYGQPRQWPYPLGSIVMERMVGDKGKVYELVQPSELTALLGPEEAPPQGAKKLTLTIKPASTAHKLVFQRNGGTVALWFHPSEEFVARVQAILKAKAA